VLSAVLAMAVNNPKHYANPKEMASRLITTSGSGDTAVARSLGSEAS
jgi:hypothetical protein